MFISSPASHLFAVIKALNDTNTTGNTKKSDKERKWGSASTWSSIRGCYVFGHVHTHSFMWRRKESRTLERKKKKKRIMAEDRARFTFLTLRWQIIRIHDRNIWIFLVSFRATKKCLYLISSHWSRSTSTVHHIIAGIIMALWVL